MSDSKNLNYIKSPYLGDFYDIMHSYMSDNGLCEHGVAHIDRDFFFARKIIHEENVSSKNWNEIFASIFFHDIARLTNGIESHGKKSADMYMKEIANEFYFLNHEAIYFTIANHDKSKAPNGDISRVDNYSLPREVNPIVPIVTWDSDRLDLYRIEKIRDKIDPNYFHTDSARRFFKSETHKAMYDGNEKDKFVNDVFRKMQEKNNKIAEINSRCYFANFS